MADFETFRTQHGQWSPRQGYRETQERSITDGSPRTNDGWTSTPISTKDWRDYPPPPPPAPPSNYDAPELADPSLYDDQHGPSLSPSSQGVATLYSPRIPAHASYLNDKEVPPPPHEPTRCGMRKRVFNIVCIVIVILLLIIGLSLGLGLGLGLKKDSSSDPNSEVDPFCRDNPQYCIGGALDSQYYSKRGAFNGSGIALAGESWNKEQRRIFTLYFQHWTGDIRYMQYTTDQKWIGGSRSETVATDAKNATALSTVAYSLNSTQYFHVFYISKTNQIKQRTYTNATNIWTDGSLNKLNLTAYSSSGTVGLQACWQGNFYGDSDAASIPTASGKANTIPFENRAAMNIWFAIDDSTFAQYAWFNGVSEDWGELPYKWQGKNTHAGVACYSWGAGTTTYAMMVSKQNNVEIYWKDTNETTVSTSQHPVQSWQNSTKAVISNVHPSTSLGFTTYFYAQMADRSMRGFNVTYQAENTTIVEEDSFTITDPADAVRGLGGTHLTMTAYAEREGTNVKWDSLYVFYQTVGDDITAFTRPIAGGEWANAKLKIPDE